MLLLNDDIEEKYKENQPVSTSVLRTRLAILMDGCLLYMYSCMYGYMYVYLIYLRYLCMYVRNQGNSDVLHVSSNKELEEVKDGDNKVCMYERCAI